MLRLGKDFGWTLVLAAGLLIPARELPAQAPPPRPQIMAPQATVPNSASPANSAMANPASSAAPNPANSATANPPSGATASPPSSTPSQARSRHKKKDATPPVAAVPQPPPPPPTLEQTAPTAPRITYQGGQLSIDAHNSTLSQVLRAVQVQTGASIEMPSSAGSERVVAQLGPGQPKDVLNTLLNGSKFDYIILGVTGNPGAVQKIILTPRQNSGMSNVNVAQNNQMPNQEQVEDETQPEEGVPIANEAEESPPPEQQAPPPPGGFRRPMMMPGGQPGPPQAGADNGEQQNGAKTPEQLMQELQQMQQQQQQYQQQLNPANQNQPQ
jgi:hypothetical protein